MYHHKTFHHDLGHAYYTIYATHDHFHPSALLLIKQFALLHFIPVLCHCALPFVHHVFIFALQFHPSHPCSPWDDRRAVPDYARGFRSAVTFHLDCLLTDVPCFQLTSVGQPCLYCSSTTLIFCLLSYNCCSRICRTVMGLVSWLLCLDLPILCLLTSSLILLPDEIKLYRSLGNSLWKTPATSA